MKIRTGFITNSSSTNFLLISKEELTEEWLFDKLGFKKGTPLEQSGRDLCACIVRAAKEMELYHEDASLPDDQSVLENFGQRAATQYRERNAKGFHTYWGHTASDEGDLIEAFFTTDSFEIDEKDLYIDGRCCVW